MVLTGTPVQGAVHELWTMFDLLVPGLLGEKKDFEREYGRPIGRATLRSASVDATAEALQKLDQLHAHLLPFILRREKSQVLQDLPPKVITDLLCELSPLQSELYASYTNSGGVRTVVDDLHRITNDSQGIGITAPDVKQLGVQALKLLHHLRLICVHPLLVQGSPADEHQRQLLSQLSCSGKLLALKDLLFSCGIVADSDEKDDLSGPDNKGGEEEEEEDEEEEEEEEEDAVEVDGLVAKDLDVVDGQQENHRCLIFAQHRVTLDAIELSILRRAKATQAFGGGKIKFLRLDGSVPSSRREELVQRFNRNPSIPIMLLTAKVGGLGLNLTGADTVIFVEHDWNPMVDLQAMDRAHRIGQERMVNVYRLITKGTVEEQIMKLQNRKRSVAEAVVTESNARADSGQLGR